MNIDDDTALNWDILEFQILALDISSLLKYASTCKRLHPIGNLLVTKIPKINSIRSITKTELTLFPNLVSLHVEDNLTNEELACFPQLTELSLGAQSYKLMTESL